MSNRSDEKHEPAVSADERAIIPERIDATLATVPRGKYPTQIELDAELWDDEGLPR